MGIEHERRESFRASGWLGAVLKQGVCNRAVDQEHVFVGQLVRSPNVRFLGEVGDEFVHGLIVFERQSVGGVVRVELGGGVEERAAREIPRS